MKTLILATALFFGSFSAVTAQTVNDNIDKPVSNIHIELLGGSNGIGIQYDRRFKGNSAWGYGIGAGWGFSYSQSDFFRFKQNYQNLSVSPRMNYLLGRKNRKLELGVGMSIGYHPREGKEQPDELLFLRQHRLSPSGAPWIPVPCRHNACIRFRRKTLNR